MDTRPPLEAPQPYIPPPSDQPSRRVLRLPWFAPFVWLRLGLVDAWRTPGITVFYGLSFGLMAWMLASVFRSSPEYTMTIASGCLLVGPFMAMGLYEVSRRREHGLAPDFASSLTCWDQHLGSMGMLVLVLIVLELLWGRASLVVFAVFFNTGMPSTSSVVAAVFNPENWEFLVAYTAVGGAFAGLVFATTVVSIPMILDRDTDAISAAITSIAVVYENTAVMVFWGAIIVASVVASLLSPWATGLLLTGPVLGYASWHAYRATVQWPQDVTVA